MAMMANDDDRKKGNLRLALILASIALVFLLGFVGKMLLLGN
jgi:hypothetical protein